ncbi:methionine--tRNA ligase [Prochlorococcus marinus]|uniref:Methionine--tRNA ligase n=1 Tax=Prochlorococcus marinus (strain MIT 9211) TaxID=93059 RepID=A9BAG6_PROM4|nr:methionine--tRNA ligase [Prochlorococcus marinus]ABX08828.1 Methionyl-tRNA synthetase [Prochlorococcus marinus str. MIT 9211]
MNITITTPLYYVNDKPHLGSTYTTIACDAYSRFQRLQGNTVEFVTGVDEHGQKIQRTAQSHQITPQVHCDKISLNYKELWKKWDITYTSFIRTTSPSHQELVNQFFDKVVKSGDILLGNQQGWYCVGCEEYKDDPPDSKSPCCPIHLKPLEWRDEENLFFALSKYQSKIESLVAQPSFIQPLSRRNEILNFVSKGLRDFSISRKNVEWGIPVPGYKGHTFYVWFDALLGYLSSLLPMQNKINLADLSHYGWPASVHVIGKDILRFHAIYWPAMLMSAGLELPKKVFGHGFLTREGQKMGKSLGNILDPELLLEQYGKDPIRWYLLSDIRFGQDGDFQQKRFQDLVNNDLANTIGNLLNRTSTMSRKWFDNGTPDFDINLEDSNLKLLAQESITSSLLAYEEFDFKTVCETVIKLATESNVYLNNTQPWTLIKEPSNKELVGYYLYNVLESCRIIGLLLLPIIPDTGSSILNQLGYTEQIDNWSDHIKWGVLSKGSILPKPTPISKKIEE